MFVALIFGSISTFGIWISLAFFPKKIPSFVFMILFLLFGAGGACQYNASFSTNIRNFPSKYRGIVVGYFASLFGISAFIFSFLYKFIFNLNLTNFMLFFSILITLVCIIGIIFINEVPTNESPNKSNNDPLPNKNYSSTSTAILSTPHKNIEESSDIFEDVDQSTADNNTENFLNQKLPHANGDEIDDDDDIIVKKRKTMLDLPPYCRLNENFKPWEVIFTLDYWICALMLFCGIGCGLCIMINLGQIVRSYSGPAANPKEVEGFVANLVSTVSICNCIGRLLFGVLSDVTKELFSRPFWFMLALGLMAFVHSLMTITPVEYLYFVCGLFGIAYGGHFALAPSYISERFGSKYYTINYSFLLIIGPSFGSFIIATLLPSFFYHKASNGKESCYGYKCYQTTFYITTCLCVLGFILGYFLMIRNRFRYFYASKLNRNGPILSERLMSLIFRIK